MVDDHSHSLLAAIVKVSLAVHSSPVGGDWKATIATVSRLVARKKMWLVLSVSFTDLRKWPGKQV